MGARPIADWLMLRPDGIRMAVKVTPRSARCDVLGLQRDADGRSYLALRVRAAPDGGKANAEAIKLLARRWGVAPRDLRLVGGASARRKVVELTGPADRLAARLRAIEEPGEGGGGGAWCQRHE